MRGAHPKGFRKSPSPGSGTLRPELRAVVRFEQLNLLGSFEHLGCFDLIFCRNVLIYQSVENKKRIIEKLGLRLAPAGYLVLGAGESLIGLSEAFDSVRLEEAIIYQPRVETPWGERAA